AAAIAPRLAGGGELLLELRPAPDEPERHRCKQPEYQARDADAAHRWGEVPGDSDDREAKRAKQRTQAAPHGVLFIANEPSSAPRGHSPAMLHRIPLTERYKSLARVRHATPEFLARLHVVRRIAGRNHPVRRPPRGRPPRHPRGAVRSGRGGRP